MWGRLQCRMKTKWWRDSVRTASGGVGQFERELHDGGDQRQRRQRQSTSLRSTHLRGSDHRRGRPQSPKTNLTGRFATPKTFTEPPSPSELPIQKPPSFHVHHIHHIHSEKTWLHRSFVCCRRLLIYFFSVDFFRCNFSYSVWRMARLSAFETYFQILICFFCFFFVFFCFFSIFFSMFLFVSPPPPPTFATSRSNHPVKNKQTKQNQIQFNSIQKWMKWTKSTNWRW